MMAMRILRSRYHYKRDSLLVVSVQSHLEFRIVAIEQDTNKLKVGQVYFKAISSMSHHDK